MKTLTKRIAFIACGTSLFILAACSSPLTNVDRQTYDPAAKYSDQYQMIQAKSCGYQLLWWFPIKVNNRLERATNQLNRLAKGGYVTDIQEKESWFYGFAGTGYCSQLSAKVYPRIIEDAH